MSQFTILYLLDMSAIFQSFARSTICSFRHWVFYIRNFHALSDGSFGRSEFRIVVIVVGIEVVWNKHCICARCDNCESCEDKWMLWMNLYISNIPTYYYLFKILYIFPKHKRNCSLIWKRRLLINSNRPCPGEETSFELSYRN